MIRFRHFIKFLLLSRVLLTTMAAASNETEQAVTNWQKIELAVSGFAFFLMLGYVIYLRDKLAKVAQRIFHGLTTPLLSQQQQQQHHDENDVELPETSIQFSDS